MDKESADAKQARSGDDKNPTY